ncbi:ABC transporter substrate-binding protein [Curtobacterium pusillum]|uniref:ABC transporter substrate-binding protein n=1 Tax=Curtobacterium pusillum TaxID=69373 RepID=A0ABX2MHU0_9MICO|nr:ABC transporter substrate-binding protein [Curtobacterium pusillum]NUU15141.1 ABC transporter substrate-binding protein [Curtobacterium pusillum]GLK31531.1 ABC transporter substrate-binding protein [Curtobacterium pusillum]
MLKATLQKEASRRTFLAGTGAIGIVAALAACSGTGSASSSKASGSAGKIDKNGTITAGMSYALGTGFDPMTTTGALTMAANWHTLEGLVELDPVTRNAAAALGKALPKQKDDTTYTVTLRDGAKFHDGSAVTIDDVLFSFQRVLDPANASLYADFLPFLSSDGVTKVDDKTVQFHIDYPFALFAERISVVKIVPKAAVQADPTGYDALPVGTGPYKLVSATANDKLVFQRFDDYNGPRKALAAGMTWNLLSDASARVSAMQSKRVDAIEDVPYLNVDGLSSVVDTKSVQSFGLLFMMFNTSAKPFDDKRVRQAFFYAIDIDKLIKNGMLGNAAAASSYVQKDHPDYVKAKTVYKHNPSKAKKLLKEAGVSGLKITLLTTDTSWVSDVAPLIKEDLDAVGIKTTLDIGQSAGQYKKVDNNQFEVMVAPGDPSVFGNDADLLLRWFYADNVWSQQRYRWTSSTEFKKLQSLLDQGAKQSDRKDQLATWGKIYDLVSDEVPLYPLLHRKLPTAWNGDALQNFKPISMTGLSFLGVAPTA